tara:strand:+ start:272 stop:481 length:210 start_codon:yes stop_codon:yes gene_type:complete
MPREPYTATAAEKLEALSTSISKIANELDGTKSVCPSCNVAGYRNWEEAKLKMQLDRAAKTCLKVAGEI